MKKVILYLVIFFGIPCLFARVVFADVLIPEPDTCYWNEIPVRCSPFEDCHSSEYRITETYTKNYYDGSSLEINKTCKKANLIELTQKHVNPLVLTLVLTILIELIVYFLSGIKKKNQLISIVLVNLISLPIAFFLLKLFFTMFFTSFENIFGEFLTKYGSLVILEAAVVCFEIFFLIHICKFDNKRKSKIIILIANVCSSIFGLIILTIANNLLQKPF